MVTERVERQAAQELDHERADDEEAALDDLIEIMTAHERERPIPQEEHLLPDEFVCRRCHMIRHRSRMGRRGSLICAECARAN